MCGMQATAVINSGLLLVAVMGLLLPTVLHYTHTEVYFGKSELALSRFSSCIMLVTYAAYLYFQLKSQRNLYVPLNEVGYEYCYTPTSARHHPPPPHTQKKNLQFIRKCQGFFQHSYTGTDYCQPEKILILFNNLS